MKYAEAPSFEGFLRPDGRKGIRNKLLIIYTVDCCWHVAVNVTDRLKAAGVDCDLVGNGQCFDSQLMIKRLLRLMLHPNVGAVLIVGHGCEFIQAEKLADYAREHGKPSAWFFDQSFGTSKSIEFGVKKGEELAAAIADTPRVKMTLRDLTIGAISVSPDGTSLDLACPAFGRLLDEHVSLGGTGIFDDIAESGEPAASFVERGADDVAKRELAHACEKVAALKAAFDVAEAGALQKSGTRPIEGVLKVTRVPKRAGLWYVDALADPEPKGAYQPRGAGAHAMELVTAGAHIVLAATGAGATLGSPLAPTVKYTANAETYALLSADIDLSVAGLSVDAAAEALTAAIWRVADGQKTRAEALGHSEGTRLTEFPQSPEALPCEKA